MINDTLIELGKSVGKILPFIGIGLFFSAILIVVCLLISHNGKGQVPLQRQELSHILIVLGSGGHTAEMFRMMSHGHALFDKRTHRTYVVTSGDHLSADKAATFENEMKPGGSFSVVTIPRARKVHQSYLTAPFSTIICFISCMAVLIRKYPGQVKLSPRYHSIFPDLIVANGPAVSLCMIIAAKIYRFFLFVGGSSWYKYPRLDTIYVESWTRTRSLSTTGLLVLPFADTFLVQWPQIAGRRAWWGMKRTIHAGWVVFDPNDFPKITEMLAGRRLA
ncbi:hypothetical protein N7495_006025 [Penicillium taxi]|uniref:uncharacterized protein n=1 Tax=Penicillium taxi TaxID=168475 RepID=UPI0025450146|nr:uncharacterized protein N7495_006025 [Penicillium taxi]KAJ5894334.1 hypothetical protein N7495_006025 [Penicillium taxi]